MHLDPWDRKILAQLQSDGRLTNQQLSEAIHLSASQCSRRRQRLEQNGVISHYRAVVDPAALGLNVSVLIEVKLHAHSATAAKNFHTLVQQCSEIHQAWTLTGNYDYLLRVMTPSLETLRDFINEVLLAHESIATVHSNIVLEVLKDGDKAILN